jgi:hypothetical protein
MMGRTKMSRNLICSFHIAPIGLHYGRISAAVLHGFVKSMFRGEHRYASSRKFGQNGGDEGMIRSLIARMYGFTCCQPIVLQRLQSEDEHLAEVFEKTSMAKYFSSVQRLRRPLML